MHHPNPFSQDDLERREIWEALMRRDFEAFLAADWSQVENDFVRQTFFGIDAGKNSDPDNWSLRYPTLGAYRDEWLRQAHEFSRVQLVGVGKLEFLFSSAQLNRIEITGDHAIGHKKFSGTATTSTGHRIVLEWQTLYKLLRVDGQWKIAGFIGYLPNNV